MRVICGRKSRMVAINAFSLLGHSRQGCRVLSGPLSCGTCPWFLDVATLLVHDCIYCSQFILGQGARRAEHTKKDVREMRGVVGEEAPSRLIFFSSSRRFLIASPFCFYLFGWILRDPLFIFSFFLFLFSIQIDILHPQYSTCTRTLPLFGSFCRNIPHSLHYLFSERRYIRISTCHPLTP